MKRLAAPLILLAVAATARAADPSPERLSPIVKVVRQAKGCVVNISAEKIVLRRNRGHSNRGDDPFDSFDDLFDDFIRRHTYRRTRVQQPLGSGVLLDKSGLVITNAHVIRRAGNLRLTLSDGSGYRAKLITADFSSDLALLRILDAKSDLKPVRMAHGPPLLGETVVALGNPFGLSDSVTSGIVSSLDREIIVGRGPRKLHFRGLIQTSALINPGNSGGPLLNLDGELVGINTAVVNEAQGIGFAMPVKQVRRIVARLLAAPDVRPVTFGVKLRGGAPAEVAQVIAASPAAEAGLRKADIIESIGGRAVRDACDFALALIHRKPGQRVWLKYGRGEKTFKTRLTLGPMPKPSHRADISRRIGASTQDMTPKLARAMSLPISWGVLISSVEISGPALRAGLAQGDILVRVDRYRVQTMAQVNRALRGIPEGEPVFVALFRRGYLAYAVVRTRKPVGD